MKYAWQVVMVGGVLGSAVGAQAQEKATVARLAAIQRVVERASGTEPFRGVKAGATLATGDSVRTGRRSKADLNFTDGSLLRLGQLATVEMRGAKDVRLSSGRVLFSMLKPGRVLAGAAAAEIKGSVGIVTVLQGGAIEFSLYSGRMDVVANAETVNVPPGNYVTVYHDGSHSPVRIAPPLRFASNQKETSLLSAPLDAPFAGSREDEQSRQTPERLLLGDIYYQARLSEQTPFPARVGVRGLPAPPFGSVSGTRHDERVDALLALGLAAGAGVVSGVVGASAPSGADEAHLNEADPSLGRKFNFDATIAALGVGYDAERGPGSVVAGRLRAFYSQGPVFAQLALSPRAVHRDSDTDSYLDLVSDASVSVHTGRGDFELGRQRLLSGPTRATAFGSIARQGGRQIVDALTYRPDFGRGQTAQVSYLFEAFPNGQPYEVASSQRGFYGRAAIQRRYGNFGLNVLRYANLETRAATGVSLDFALPLVRNNVELYGEGGRDPFRRQVRTVGLAFPGLYERTGVEGFLEYARLSDSNGALNPPNELALLLYKRLNSSFALTAGISHFGNSSNAATIGITTSTHKYLSDGD